MEVEGEGWVRDTPAGGHCQLGGVGNHTHHTSKPHNNTRRPSQPSLTTVVKAEFAGKSDIFEVLASVTR